MAQRQETRDGRSGKAGRLGVILVLIALALGNSLLFYFVIWPEFHPADPFSALLFFISGAAHLIYFFIPWFLVDIVGGSVGSGGNDPSRYDTDLSDGASGFFLRLCTLVGVLSCATVVTLSLLKDHIGQAAPTPVTITRANCLHAGGVPKLVDGRLRCDFEAARPRETEAVPASSDGRV